MEDYHWEGERWRMGEKVQGLRSIICRYKIDGGVGGGVKNSIENGEAKELTCMVHGHELRGDSWREGVSWAEGGKGEKLGQL